MTRLAVIRARIAPWVKCLVAAVTGALVIVITPLVFADVAAIALGGEVSWPAASVLWRTGLAAAAVVGTTYWMHSPKGREVWTDEQRQAMRELKEGKS